MDRSIRRIVFLLSIWGWLSLATVTAQQSPLPGIPPTGNSASAAAQPPSEDLDARRKDVAQRLLVAQRTLDSVPAASDTVDKSEPLTHEVELLKQLDTVYAQRQSAEGSREELRAAETEVNEQLQKLRSDGPDEERPYSFLLLDSLRDQLTTSESRAEVLNEELSAASEELDRAKAAHEELQAERRRLKEKLTQETASNGSSESALQLKSVELEASIAEQSLALRRAELDNAKTQKRIQESRIKLLEETVAMVKFDVRFSQSDLQSQLVDIGKEESDLKQEIEAAECTLQALDQHWNEVRVKLASTLQKSPALIEEEKAAKLARDCQSRRIAIANKQQGFLGLSRQAWRRRYALATGAFARTDLAEWKDETQHAVEQVDYERQFAELRVKDCRKILADLDERSEAAGDQPSELKRWIAEERSLVDQLSETYGQHLTTLESFDNLYGKLLEELENKQASLSLWDRLSATADATSQIWNYELAVFDEKSVTVGKAVWGLGLLAFGVYLSRKLINRYAGRVLGHFGIEGGAALAFESLSYYVFVVAWGLLALRTVHVPLTVFAFMGGAVAIGVGFGSQKILNNFISGVILLVEQPIRVGDVIEIGGLQGTVDSIGTRSTRIRTGANSEIIVPNSAFLESNVINWTLGDTTARCTVRVVVVRGSRAREAARLIERAGLEHGKILKTPAPFVRFADFNEHGLALELHCWLDVRDRAGVESDLRFMIDHYLREAGIELAVAQRDASPLVVVSRDPPPNPTADDDPLDSAAGRSAA